MKASPRKHLLSLGYYLLLSLLVLPFALPLLWLTLTAFKPAAEMYQRTVSLFPTSPTITNFVEAWQLVDFPRYFRNSFFVTGFSVLGTVLSCSLVGYAFAFLSGRGSRIIFAFILASFMLPNTVSLIPLFILYSKLGWIDTYMPLIMPHFFANGFYVFLFRQFFLTLPNELFDQAEIDGCNPLMAYWFIALPLSFPALATVALFSAISSWNEFLEPLLFLTSERNYTVSLGLSYFQGLYVTQIHYLIPMTLVSLLPVLLLFLATQPLLMKGVVARGGHDT